MGKKRSANPCRTQASNLEIHGDVKNKQQEKAMETKTSTYRILQPQHTELQRGLIYVMRRINGTDVPLRIHNQMDYKEWAGCFSAL